ncbi:unnamed protein product [Amaranthus hypochondriacus]
MKGGRSGRGRGGRGRGDGAGNTAMVTRSSIGEIEKRVPDSNSKNDAEELDNESEQRHSEEQQDEDDSCEEEEDMAQVKEELQSVKKLLNEIQLQLKNSGSNNSEASQPQRSSIETSRQQNWGHFELNETRTEQKDEDFPALEGSIPTNRVPTTLLPSWRDKVTTPKTQLGMSLKFVPPMVEDGQLVVQIESQDVNDLARFWDCSVVIYVVGGIVSTDILKGFIRKQWTFVNMPVIHSHEDGYYIVKFSSDKECTEILNGGPYFLNKAPMIVKKWNTEFDFNDEILRVIPVWIRLPSLPLHCWGVETLSRIVSAVGVPILADDCTAKQTKVSYARVLVEVDVTKEFVKEIKIRDNNGKEFVQKAIPEWKPYYCRFCHKLGHECKEEGGENKQQKEDKKMEEGKQRGKNMKWIPTSIARIIQGVANLEDLKAKIREEDTKHDEVSENLINQQGTNDNTMNLRDKTVQPGSEFEGAADDSMCGDTVLQDQVDDDEEGWTPVAPGKGAKRGQFRKQEAAPEQNSREKKCSSNSQVQEENKRDGNPQIPSVQ